MASIFLKEEPHVRAVTAAQAIGELSNKQPTIVYREAFGVIEVRNPRDEPLKVNKVQINRSYTYEPPTTDIPARGTLALSTWEATKADGTRFNDETMRIVEIVVHGEDASWAEPDRYLGKPLPQPDPVIRIGDVTQAIEITNPRDESLYVGRVTINRRFHFEVNGYIPARDAYYFRLREAADSDGTRFDINTMKILHVELQGRNDNWSFEP